MIIWKGDEIRVETSKYQDIISVKSMIEQELSNNSYSNILYLFDLRYLSKYTDDEIKKILSTSEVK